MVDTRCANPSYQLDVDSMMLEYVAFKAIASQLQVFEQYGVASVPNVQNTTQDASYHKNEAARLTETFSILLRSFKVHHHDTDHTESLQIDILFLKFMTLLSLWLDQAGSGKTAFAIDSDMRQNLTLDQRINHYFRDLWKRSSNGGNRSSQPTSTTVKNKSPELRLADHLLPLFMFISATLSKGNTDLSERWMDLAALFMVQAGIELLDSPQLFAHGPDAARSSLEECFAWGYVPRQTYENNRAVKTKLMELVQDLIFGQDMHEPRIENYIEVALSREDECWRMFFVEDQDTAAKMTDDEHEPPSSGEMPQWTQLRQRVGHSVLTTFQMLVENNDSEERKPVDWLRTRFKLSDFLKCLGEFITYSWQETHSYRGYGQPIMVQIEQGHLIGLSPEQFQDLIAKAGIGE